ncbi:MAG TPA: hypothetical protein VFZ61_03485 [Polyangiales bacterium]
MRSRLPALPSRLVRTLAALGVWLMALGALAHAPETRGLALTPDGQAMAIALPGFGLVLRSGPSQPFVYTCGALLGIKPSTAVPALAFLDDGTLLVGSPDGLRKLGADGCPRASSHALVNTPVVALALAPSARHIVYAVVAGERPGVWRSVDGGEHWELRAPLVTPGAVSALVIASGDPERVVLSETTPQATLVRASSDGGRSFVAHPQPFELTLLHVRSGVKERWWAMARDALSVGNRGRAILRTDSPELPWQMPTRVAYFGGFVVDARGVISIGDELGGVLRSDDAGETFHQLPTEVPVACLAQASDALWACTPGTLDEAAVQRMSVSEPFKRVVALPEVTRLATCAPELEVERVCAAAWVEWQRDVLRIPAQAADAGMPAPMEEPAHADAALTEVDASVSRSGEQEGEPSAGEQDGEPPASPMQAGVPSSSGCALTDKGRGEGPAALLVLLLMCCSRRRRAAWASERRLRI